MFDGGSGATGPVRASPTDSVDPAAGRHRGLRRLDRPVPLDLRRALRVRRRLPGHHLLIPIDSFFPPDGSTHISRPVMMARRTVARPLVSDFVELQPARRSRLSESRRKEGWDTKGANTAVAGLRSVLHGSVLRTAKRCGIQSHTPTDPAARPRLRLALVVR